MSTLITWDILVLPKIYIVYIINIKWFITGPITGPITGVVIEFTSSTYDVKENAKPVVEIKVASGEITSPVTIE